MYAHKIDLSSLKQVHLHVFIEVQVKVRIVIAVHVPYTLALLVHLLHFAGERPHIPVEIDITAQPFTHVIIVRDVEYLKLILVEAICDNKAFI